MPTATWWALLLAAAPGPGDAMRECRRGAAPPHNAWALAHGIIAAGAGFRASDGRLATEVLFQDFLARTGEAPGSYAFPPSSADGTPVESHPDLIEKTLVLAGVRPAAPFQTRYGPVTLADLIAQVQARFRRLGPSDPAWAEGAWTLDLLGHQLDPARASFTNRLGEPIDFNKVMDDALTFLEEANAALGGGLDRGLAVVPKDKQGIYAHPCGGLHLVQAVLTWARHPSVKLRWGPRVGRQIDILFYRFGSERRQYQRALEQFPQLQRPLLEQQLKFYGHFLETVGRLEQENGLRPNPVQATTVRAAADALAAVVRDLGSAHAFDPRSWDVIGDACHAAHGLALIEPRP